MASFAEIRDAHPELDPAFPVDWARPTLKEIRRIEGKFALKYPQDFIDFQLKECHTTPMGDFAFDYGGQAPDRRWFRHNTTHRLDHAACDNWRTRCSTAHAFRELR